MPNPRNAAAASGLTALLLLAGLLGGLPSAGADQQTTFGAGSATVSLDYPVAGTASTTVRIANDATVTRAAFDVQSLERTPGAGYATNISVDAGGDGQPDWSFAGVGIGAPGFQDRLTTGAMGGVASLVGAGGGANTANRLYLPKYAKVLSAVMDVTGAGSTHFPERGRVLKGTASNGNLGYAADGAGDVNGDGWDDLLLGVTGADRAELYYGGPAMDSNRDMIIQGAFGSSFGQSVAGLGDINNDGSDDFAIGENGTVWVYFGGPGVDAVPDATLYGDFAALSYFGFSLAGGSDITGDGHPDLVVGDPFNNWNGTFTGKAYVFRGGPGFDALFDDRLQGDPIDGFGDAVATGGDITGDGFDDLVVGAPDLFGGPMPAAAWIFAGGPSFGGGPITILYSPRTLDIFGYSLTLSGDWTGDGTDDLWVGAPFNGSGRAYLFRGRSVWPPNPPSDALLGGEFNGDSFTTSLALLGDLTGDGRSELLVGAATYDPPGKNLGGRAYFINGSAVPSLAGAITYDGAMANAEAGWVVRRAGDITGDGDPDFVVTAPFNDTGRGNVDILSSAWGITGPRVRLGAVAAPALTAGPIMNRTVTATFDPVALQSAVTSAPVAFTDASGNQFVSLTVTLESTGPGTLTVGKIRVGYTADTSVAMDLTAGFNAYLAVARGILPAGDPADVPIVVSSGTVGRLLLADLRVDFTPNQIPVAVIDSIVPMTLEVGDNVTFTGHGTDDGSIRAYRWSSDREEPLGSLAAVTAPLTKIGLHTVSLEVQDDRGRWSLPVTEVVLVDPVNEAPVATIDEPAPGTSLAGFIDVTGTAADPNPEDVLSVEVRIDDGAWEPATGSDPWSYSWDGANATDGPHRIEARATDGRLASPVVTVDVLIFHPAPVIAVTAPANRDAFPGETVRVVFSVANTGTAGADVLFASQTTPDLRPVVGTKGARLEPGSRADVEVRITVPTQMPAGTVVKVILLVTELGTPGVLGSGSTNLRVVERPSDPSEQSVKIDPPKDGKVRAGKAITYVFSITNTGTAPDEYNLTVTGTGAMLVVVTNGGAPLAGPLALAPGSSAAIQVTVTPPRTTAGTTQRLTMSAQSVRFPLVNDQAEVVTTVVSGPGLTNDAAASWMWATIAVVTIVGSGLGATVAGTEWGRYRFFWLLLPLYTRIRRDEVLDNFARGEINGFVRFNPGTYYNEIKRHLNLSNGVLTYHLNRLEQEGYVRSRNNGRYKLFYPSDMPIPDHIILLTEFQRALLRFVRDSPAATQQAIADQQDIPLATVSRHLRKLVDIGFISVERGENLLLQYRLTPAGFTTVGTPPGWGAAQVPLPANLPPPGGV